MPCAQTTDSPVCGLGPHGQTGDRGEHFRPPSRAVSGPSRSQAPLESLWVKSRRGRSGSVRGQCPQDLRLYTDAPQLAKEGVEVHSIDEMTGIKVREHTHPALPMRSGKPEALEFVAIHRTPVKVRLGGSGGSCRGGGGTLRRPRGAVDGADRPLGGCPAGPYHHSAVPQFGGTLPLGWPLWLLQHPGHTFQAWIDAILGRFP